jgi:hypothetical protein
MFANDTERKVFAGVLTTVLVLILGCGIAYYIIILRDRNPLYRDSAAAGNHANTHHRWRVTRSPVNEIEKPELTISPPVSFRPLRLVEKGEVESIDKKTVAQARRNAMERAGLANGIGGSNEAWKAVTV